MTTIKYSNIAFAILLALCALLVSKSIWSVYLLLTPPQIMHHHATSSINKTSSTIQSAQPDLDIILSNNPYGAYQHPSLASKTDKNIVSNTRLDIKIIGILHGNQSVAIINYQGQQRAISEGGFINKSTEREIQVTDISENYILILNNGVEEKIQLPDIKREQIFKPG